MSVYAGDDYLGFCEGLRELSGVDLTQYKRPQMERRLRSFLERRGFRGLMESLPQLRADKSELEALLDRMTINVSQLWRNPEHWRLLETKVLPELGEKGRVTAWSAGCSYGAEAYTLGAICRQVIPKANVSIRGTDIDKRMVERAKRGLFSVEDARSCTDCRDGSLLRARRRRLAGARGVALDDAFRARRSAQDPAAARPFRSDPLP